MTLTNGEGQILTYNSGSQYYYATASAANYQSLRFSTSNSRIRLSYRSGNRSYYFAGISNGQGTVSRSGGVYFTPQVMTKEAYTVPLENQTYLVTNTPLERETSVKVTKVWDTGENPAAEYETLRVTVQLVADGKDTGRTVTLDMQNGWTDTFRGLPYVNGDGSVVVYTVEEVPVGDNWTPSVSVQTLNTGQTPTYAVTVTNTYRNMQSAELPATGSPARMYLVAGGGMLMAIALFMGIAERRKRERRGG